MNKLPNDIPFRNGKKAEDVGVLTEQLAQIMTNVDNFPIQVPELDDSGRIQRAIDSIKDIGGTVFFSNNPNKTYTCQGLTVTGNKSITLEGRATLKLPNNATSNLLTFGYDAEHRILGLTLNGNKVNVSSTVHAIHLLDNDTGLWRPSAYMDGLTIKEFTGNAINIGIARSGGKLKNSFISKCVYGLKTPNTSTVADWTVERNDFGDNDYNIYGNFSAGLFTNNAIYRAKFVNVTFLGQTWYSWLIGNSIDTSQQVGLAINGDPTKDNMIMIIGNTFFGNSASGEGLYSDITVSNINLTNIVGNTFFRYEGAYKTKYAVEFLASNNRVITFANNNFNSANFTVGVVSDTSKVYGYNAGLPLSVAENATFKGTLKTNGAYTQAPTSSGNLVQQSVVQGEGYARWQLLGDGRQRFGDGLGATDSTFYRSGVNTLKTDGKLLATNGLGVGNSATATTLGSISKKMEVFDANGNSLGFVPIYSSIT